MRQENECYANDWKLIPFNSNIEMLSGFPFDSNNFNDSKGLPLIRIRNIISGNTDTFYDGDYSIEFLINKGDILIGMDGDFHIKRWKGAPALLNQRILKLFENKNSEINLEFFYYLAQPFLLNVHKRTAGTTVKHLSTKDFRNASFKVPKYPEQQKIAEILSTVDAKIEVIEQQITETQALKKGLMQRLLTKGIGHTEFKDSALGEIPKSWEVVTGEEISSTITKGASPKWQGFEYQNEGLLFVTSENVRDGLLDISKPKFLPLEFNEKIKKSKLKNGDILINIVGASIGRSCMYKSNFEFANINQAICLLRVKGELLSKYILYYLQSEETINRLLGAQNGSARQNLSLTDIRKFKFVIPSEGEQQKMIEVFASVSDKLEVLSQKKTYYQELKQGLMQQLLTGKVRVNTTNRVIT